MIALNDKIIFSKNTILETIYKTMMSQFRFV